jgi:hypothetical protein
VFFILSLILMYSEEKEKKEWETSSQIHWEYWLIRNTIFN